MASADVEIENKMEDSVPIMCLNDSIEMKSVSVDPVVQNCVSVKGNGVASETEQNSVHSENSDANLVEDGSSKTVVSLTTSHDSNNNEASTTKKVHFNGLKSDNIEQNIKNHVLHVNAQSWPFKTDTQPPSDKQATTLPYTYGGKMNTFQQGASKPFNNTRSPTKRQYGGMTENPNNCSSVPGIGNVNANCHGNAKGEHVVYLHVNPGETIYLYMSDHTQHIQGPATVRMVSCNSTPPMPVPVQVPPGHMVQQLADENWILREIILSPQPPVCDRYLNSPGTSQVAMPVCPPYNTGSSYGTGTPTGPAGSLPFYVYPPHLSFPHPLQYHSHMQPGMSNHTMHGGHTAGTNGQGQYTPMSPPSGMHKDERTQKQLFKLKRRLESRQRDGTFHRPDVNDGNGRHDGRPMPYDYDANKQDLASDQTKVIYDFLSKVKLPTISDVTARSALTTWSALSTGLEKSEWPEDIKEEDILYILLISDKGPDIGKKIAYRGKELTHTLADLKPGLSYYVCVQATVDDVCGKSSDSVNFKTAASHPEPPQPPKLISRTRTSLHLKWNAAVDNGSRILNYILEYDEGLGQDNFTEVFHGLQKQFKIPKLRASTCYKFRLCAENDLGMSTFSDTACFSTSGSPPSQPLPPELVQSTSCSITVRWEARPNDDRFTLQAEEEGSLHGFLPVYNGVDTSYICMRLRRNTLYKFRLCAHNEEGHGPWSEVVSFSTLPERPLCPSRPALKGRIHSTQFKVSWDAPKDDGGSPVTSYELEMKSSDDFQVIYFGPELEFLCEHLQPGTTYTFRVRCTSVGGTSLFSETSSIQTLPVVPGKCLPPRLSGKAKSNSLHIKWTSPDYDGGSEILDYEVEILNPDSSTRQVYKGHDLDCEVAGLFPGRQYSFIVRARNKVGVSPYSDVFEIVSGAGVPDVPNEIQAVPRSPHSIFISWSEPLNNGAAITEYRVETSRNDTWQLVYSGDQLNSEIKNLIPATIYSFRVLAVNSVGAGAFSEPISCQTPPSSPGSIPSTTIRSVSDATSISLQWKEPNDHGSPILRYNVEIGESIFTSVDTPELYLQDLTPKTTYKVRIQAVNGIGLGHFSSINVATRGLPPNPPFLESIGCTHNSLRLKWGDGKNPEFIRYTLELLNTHSGNYYPIFEGVGHSHKVSRLEENTDYTFRIYASNNEGDGPNSESYMFSTTKAVPSTPKSPKVSSVTETSCVAEWLPSRSVGDDMLLYKLQLGSKSTDYTVVYTGIQTNFVLRDLCPGTEYSVRVAAIRHCGDGSGDLSSPFSPSTGFCTNVQVSKHAPPKPTSVISSWSQREPLTDQQWAIILLCGFTIFAILFAIIANWLISYVNS